MVDIWYVSDCDVYVNVLADIIHQSYQLLKTFNRVYGDLPLFYILAYAAGNIVLQSLNWFWLASNTGLKKQSNAFTFQVFQDGFCFTKTLQRKRYQWGTIESSCLN